MKCNKCHEKVGIHVYGKDKLCDECLNFVEKKLKSKKEEVTIELPYVSKIGCGATYQHGDGIIRVYDFSRLSPELCLSHEIIHHVLNYFVSVQASYCYDNIDGAGQLHKELGLI